MEWIEEKGELWENSQRSDIAGSCRALLAIGRTLAFTLSEM